MDQRTRWFAGPGRGAWCSLGCVAILGLTALGCGGGAGQRDGTDGRLGTRDGGLSFVDGSAAGNDDASAGNVGDAGRSDAGCVSSDRCTCAPDGRCRRVCSASVLCASGMNCCGGFCYAESCVTTLAGSGRTGAPDAPFAQAFINGTYGMAGDSAGNMFFTEWMPGGLRVVNNGTSAIGRVPPGWVGSLTGGRFGCKEGLPTEAELGIPVGLTRDPTGDFYLADTWCKVVWKVAASDFRVKRIAGEPQAAAVTDGDFAQARLHNPRGIAFGPDDNLYVSEYDRHVIRRVTLAGTVTTIAGKAGTPDEVDGAGGPEGAARFQNPAGLAFGPDQALFVGDWTSGAVRKIDGATGATPAVSTIVAPKANPVPDPNRPWVPNGYGSAAHSTLSVNGQGQLHINFWNNGLWRLSPPVTGAAWTVEQLIGTSTVDRVISHAFVPGGDVLWLGGWVNSSTATASNTIRRVSPALTVGQPDRIGVRDGAGNVATFNLAACDGALTVDVDGNVWVAERCSARVRKITPAGVVTSIGTGQQGEAAGPATSARFCGPSALLADGAYVYVANRECSGRISRIERSTGHVTLIGSTAVAGEPGIPLAGAYGGMALDAAGNLYLTTHLEPGAGASTRYGSYSDWMPMVLKIPNRGADPATFFAGTPNNSNTPGNRNTCRDGVPGTGQFGTWPYGLVIDKAGVLYVADGACGVRKVASDGTLSTLRPAAEVSALGLAIAPGPYGEETLFVGGSGHVLVAMNRLTGETQAYAGAGSSAAAHYQDGPAKGARFWGPYALAGAADGRIFVLDSYNNRIRIILP